MATATAVNTFIENNSACLAVRVLEANGRNVEYIGRVDLSDAFEALTNAEKKDVLVAAVKAARDAQIGAARTVPTITGTVTV